MADAASMYCRILTIVGVGVVGGVGGGVENGVGTSREKD